MPIVRKPKHPATGIGWVDSLVKAMGEDPTGGIGPSSMAAPLQVFPQSYQATGLLRRFAKRFPTFHRALQKSPDVILEHPADVPAARYLGPLGGRTPRIEIAERLGTREESPLYGLGHETLHHLWGSKQIKERLAKGLPITDEWILTPEFAQWPIEAAERMARKHHALPPKWLEQSVRKKFGYGNPEYWSEQAIEAMQALIKQGAARQKAARRLGTEVFGP